MNLDELFEDLEAQFDGYLAESKGSAGLEHSHLMRVWHRGGQITELAAPILGTDFVAGMALGANVFRLIRLVAVSKIALIELTNADVPTSRHVSLETKEFLERLPLPFSLRWQPLHGDLPGFVTLRDLLGETLLVESNHPENFQLLPLSAIAHFELIDVENFGGEA
jgi:hypothetical protein